MDGSNNTTNLKLSSKDVKEEFTLKLEEVLSRFGSMVTRPTFSTTMGGASPVLLEDCGIKIAKMAGRSNRHHRVSPGWYW